MSAPAPARQPDRADWVHAALVGTALLALYAATSPRSVGPEDDGLFILSSYFLGIEHPPGYPLFTILGKLFTLLPFGSVAYRVHLLSALFGALACAALWMCVRQLVEGRPWAHLAALGLGLSPAFWSQAIIAEVYTFNAFFLFVLLYLALRPANRATLPLIACILGLSLANHWPLMGVVAPGLLVLLWPLRKEALRLWLPVGALFIAGLSPYAWMVVRSWDPLPVSFYGPLENWREIWFMLSRSGYSTVDVSRTADWLDRARFFGFLGSELLLQFAIAGSLLAAVGFWAQWRAWGRRIGWSLTLAFLGPSVILLLLLGFDYDAVQKEIYRVYPLPAYGIAALWMALGAAWLAQRLDLRVGVQRTAAAVLIGAMLAAGWLSNSASANDWTARYARTLLDAVPQGAAVVALGDADLVPLAYLHMVEGRRPDITLIQPLGLILGNRPLHPLRVSEAAMKELVMRRLAEQTGVVVSTLFAEEYLGDLPRKDHWLYQVVDRTVAQRRAIEIEEPLVRFFEQELAETPGDDTWTTWLKGQLKQRYARVLGMQLSRSKPLAPRAAAQLEALSHDFHGALGLLEGLMANPEGYQIAQAIALLDEVSRTMPPDATKRNRARYFELRAYLRRGQRDETGALADLKTAVSMWPVKDNGAVAPLRDHYTSTNDQAALAALQASLKR